MKASLVFICVFNCCPSDFNGTDESGGFSTQGQRDFRPLLYFLIFRCFSNNTIKDSHSNTRLCFSRSSSGILKKLFFFSVGKIQDASKCDKILFSKAFLNLSSKNLVNFSHILLTPRSRLSRGWKEEKFWTCPLKFGALWNTTSDSLRVFFWVKCSNSYSEGGIHVQRP